MLLYNNICFVFDSLVILSISRSSIVSVLQRISIIHSYCCSMNVYEYKL